MKSARRNVDWVIGYYDKDGSSFMGTGEPWIEGDFDNKCEATKKALEMIIEGYILGCVAPRTRINKNYKICIA